MKKALFVLLFLIPLLMSGHGVRGRENDDKTNALIKELKSDDDVDRRRAAEKLGKLGAEAFAALKALKELMQKDPNAEVRKAAQKAIELIEVPGLLLQLKSKNEGEREKAARDLGKVGTKEVISVLEKVAKDDPQESVKKRAKEAIALIESRFIERWELVELFLADGGGATYGAPREDYFAEVKGNAGVLSTPDGMKIRFKLDPGQAPKQIDLAWPDKSKIVTLQGIYRIDGDTLIISHRIKPGLARPTGFRFGNDLGGKDGIRLTFKLRTIHKQP